MAMIDPTIKHPEYLDFAPSWQLMRDAVAGEDDVKNKGEQYLPMKSGTAAIEDSGLRSKVYNLYKIRAGFPEITAPTIRGAVGVMLARNAKIELPESMEHLRERATLDGLTLDALHRRIATEVMTTGRYGLLPSVDKNGIPYLSGYAAESVINWDTAVGVPDFVMLDETAVERNQQTGEWETVDRLRECVIADGQYRSFVYTKPDKDWVREMDSEARTARGQPIDFLPFVFIGSLDLTPEPDDVPMYGLAKLAVRIYRMDADYSFSLHMTSEPTPVAIGFDDPQAAVKNGYAPKTLGSSVIWILPEGGDAKYLEFSGQGLEKQAEAIKASFEQAEKFGAQVLQSAASNESGEALKMRAASQTATLTSIAQTTAAGLEKALRNLAVWMGEDPELVTVTPNLDFFGRSMSAQDITALVSAWQQGAISHPALFKKLQQGGVLDEDAQYADEEAAITSATDDDNVILSQQNTSAEGATIVN